MAFNTNPGKQQFTATAGQTVFTFNFAIFADTNIKVYKTPSGQVANDTADLLTLSTNYTVSINGTLGGTVTLLVGAGLNDTITIVRNLPVSRTTDYQTNGDLYADTLDADQDYQTYLVQDGYVQLERAIILPESLSGTDVNIPAPVANSYLRWNATADALENDTSIPNDVVTTTNNVALTNADVVLTHADVVSTNADVVLAQKWATELEDVVVSGGQFSAFHWATKAAASAASLVIDATPTDGSSNAVSSNGVFDALSGKSDTTGDFFTGGISISTSNLITNGTFDTDTSWTKDVGWTISGGIASFNNANGSYIRQPQTLVAGKKYIVEMIISNYVAGSVYFYYNGANISAAFSANGMVRAWFIGASSTDFRILAIGGSNLSIDNIILKEVPLHIDGDISITGAITALRETKVAMGANNIDLSAGNLFTKTISGATTLTVSNWLATGNANSFILELTNGGSAVITYPTGSKFAGGTTPTLTASGKDILGCYSHDGGTTLNWIIIGKDVK